MADHRQSARIPFRLRVKYGLSRPTSSGYTFNLSERGIGITSQRVFPPKSKIVIHIFAGDRTLRLEGSVAWTSPVLPGRLSKMGVKFLSRTDDVRDIYLQRLNRKVADTSSVSNITS